MCAKRSSEDRPAGGEDGKAGPGVESPGVESPGRFPVVALGASAGGIEPLNRFFSAMPPDQGIAFIVVMHLAPAHESHLAELLRRHTEMPVNQVQDSDGQVLQPDHVYVIPPNHSLAVRHGRLRLGQAAGTGGARVPFDHLLRSLAEDQQERAICIVLSGNGSDGSLGLRDIKAEGGLVMAQDPATAEYGGMPGSAIASGLVDFVLPIEQMPHALLEYVRHSHLHGPPAETQAAGPPDEAVLPDIVSLLRVRAGQDFRPYKKQMVLRRIRRRMGLVRVNRLAEYHRMLRDSAAEVAALRKDLLIGVTSFFREPEAWQALAHDVIAPLVRAAAPEAHFRVWVPGCSTGEEAYTIGMLMAEQMEIAGHHGRVTIFATDVDRQALNVGRDGRYPENIAAAISPERLRHFFTRQGEHYTVKKELREMVLFAPQNLLTDPPFSRLDLVSCRNLLIYLEPEQQKKLIALFHFALNTNGALLLGKSESVGQHEDLFDPVVKKWRLYRRLGGAPQPPLAVPVPSESGGSEPRWTRPARAAGHAEVVQRLLLNRYAPAAVLVNRERRVLYVSGNTDEFLAQPAGEPTDDLLAIARDDLRLKLRTLLHKAAQDAGVASGTLQVTREGRARQVEIGLMPAPDDGQRSGLQLVTFTARAEPPAPPAREPDSGAREMQLLEDELQLTRRELQAAVEELESANEELKVANEEAMSTNEELQSANEELETSKEELQSLNEELTTVNSQLEEKVADLEEANNDLTNLLTSTHLPTLFLDRKFRIKRFTPATTRLFQLISSDLNRPVTDIVGKCPIDELLADAQHVLEDLVPIERETLAEGGGRYLRRVLPYRTQEERIEGVVVTFTDISEMRHTADQLARSEARAHRQADELAALYNSAPIGLGLFDRQLRCVRINDALARACGGTDGQHAEGRTVAEVLPCVAGALPPLLQHVITAGQAVHNVELRGSTPDRTGSLREWLASLVPLRDNQGAVQHVSVTLQDITERRRIGEDVRRGRARLQRMVDTAQVGILFARADGTLLEANEALLRMLGYAPGEQPAAPLTWGTISPPDLAANHKKALLQVADGGTTAPVESALLSKDGTRVPVLWSAAGLDNGSDEHVAFLVDLTERKRVEARLAASQNLAARMQQAREDERTRIAREIHDDLGATLTGIKMHLHAARVRAAQTGSKGSGPDPIEALPGLIDAATDAVNRIIGDLRPSVLDHLGVWAAIGWYAERMLPAAAIEMHVDFSPELEKHAVAPERATAIFRIVQEALTNVLRHAGAKNVWITGVLERDSNTVALNVDDDGKGIAPDAAALAASGIDGRAGGLLNMRERAEHFGGELRVTSRKSGGTAVELRMPLENPG